MTGHSLCYFPLIVAINFFNCNFEFCLTFPCSEYKMLSAFVFFCFSAATLVASQGHDGSVGINNLDEIKAELANVRMENDMLRTELERRDGPHARRKLLETKLKMTDAKAWKGYVMRGKCCLVQNFPATTFFIP